MSLLCICQFLRRLTSVSAHGRVEHATWITLDAANAMVGLTSCGDRGAPVLRFAHRSTRSNVEPLRGQRIFQCNIVPRNTSQNSKTIYTSFRLSSRNLWPIGWLSFLVSHCHTWRTWHIALPRLVTTHNQQSQAIRFRYS